MKIHIHYESFEECKELVNARQFFKKKKTLKNLTFQISRWRFVARLLTPNQFLYNSSDRNYVGDAVSAGVGNRKTRLLVKRPFLVLLSPFSLRGQVDREITSKQQKARGCIFCYSKTVFSCICFQITLDRIRKSLI